MKGFLDFRHAPAFTRGNRCGHDPRAWRTSLNRPQIDSQGVKKKKPPLVLQLAAKSVVALMWDRLLPEFGHRQRKLFSQSERERRSERLEAIVLVVLALLVRCDVLTLRIRWRGRGLPLREICQWTGIERRRVQRALHDLRYALYVCGPGEQGPGVIRQPIRPGEPQPAIREFTLLFFDRLGLKEKLIETQDERWAELEALGRRRLPSAVLPIDYLSPRADRCARICYTQPLAAQWARGPNTG